jgi:thiamine-phosphate pyrophosphorylase
MNRPQLHVLTDPVLSRGRSHLEIAQAALAGGADIIQVRDKTLEADALAEKAVALLFVVRQAGKLLVVNDSLSVARRIDADGLHLGPQDVPLAAARALWPHPKLLGGSARAVARARQLAAEGADYLGVGPVYGTASKPDAPGAIGLDRLARIAAAVDVPVIGIGGIEAANAAAVIQAGAAGVAVLSAVVAAEDVLRATREIRAAIDAT